MSERPGSPSVVSRLSEPRMRIVCGAPPSTVSSCWRAAESSRIVEALGDVVEEEQERDGGRRRHRGDDHECCRHEAPADAAFRRLADTFLVVVCVAAATATGGVAAGGWTLCEPVVTSCENEDFFPRLEARVRGLALRLDVGEGEGVRLDGFPADRRGGRRWCRRRRVLRRSRRPALRAPPTGRSAQAPRFRFTSSTLGSGTASAAGSSASLRPDPAPGSSSELRPARASILLGARSSRSARPPPPSLLACLSGEGRGRWQVWGSSSSGLRPGPRAARRRSCRRLSVHTGGQRGDEVGDRAAVARERRDRDPLVGAMVARAGAARTRPLGCLP